MGERHEREGSVRKGEGHRKRDGKGGKREKKGTKEWRKEETEGRMEKGRNREGRRERNTPPPHPTPSPPAQFRKPNDDDLMERKVAQPTNQPNSAFTSINGTTISMK